MLTMYVGLRVKEQCMTSSGAAGDGASLSVVKPRVGMKPLTIYTCGMCVYVWGHVLGHW